MPPEPTDTNRRPWPGRTVEDLLRAALRAEGFLIPRVVEDVPRFEAERAQAPVEVPAHVLTPEWLFGVGHAREGGMGDGGWAGELAGDAYGTVLFASAPRARDFAAWADWATPGYGDDSRLELTGAAEALAGAPVLVRIESPDPGPIRLTPTHELGHFCIDTHRWAPEDDALGPLAVGAPGPPLGGGVPLRLHAEVFQAVWSGPPPEPAAGHGRETHPGRSRPVRRS